MTGGGASGNVIAYNYLHEILFDDPWWLIASPSINHAPHPKMNLWEGDIGIKAEGGYHPWLVQPQYDFPVSDERLAERYHHHPQ